MGVCIYSIKQFINRIGMFNSQCNQTAISREDIKKQLQRAKQSNLKDGTYEHNRYIRKKRFSQQYDNLKDKSNLLKSNGKEADRMWSSHSRQNSMINSNKKQNMGGLSYQFPQSQEKSYRRYNSPHQMKSERISEKIRIEKRGKKQNDCGDKIEREKIRKISNKWKDIDDRIEIEKESKRRLQGMRSRSRQLCDKIDHMLGEMEMKSQRNKQNNGNQPNKIYFMPNANKKKSILQQNEGQMYQQKGKTKNETNTKIDGQMALHEQPNTIYQNLSDHYPTANTIYQNLSDHHSSSIQNSSSVERSSKTSDNEQNRKKDGRKVKNIEHIYEEEQFLQPQLLENNSTNTVSEIYIIHSDKEDKNMQEKRHVGRKNENLFVKKLTVSHSRKQKDGGESRKIDSKWGKQESERTSLCSAAQKIENKYMRSSNSSNGINQLLTISNYIHQGGLEKEKYQCCHTIILEQIRELKEIVVACMLHKPSK